MKAIGCVNNGTELLRAIFTLGLACMFDNDTKKEYLNVKADLREEQAIMEAISKRMDYFDDLLGAAETLVKESSNLIATTTQFRQALVNAEKILSTDYTEEEIKENLGDVDFANEFAEELFKVLDELKTECLKVAEDCRKTKDELDLALSNMNKYMTDEQEEELVELQHFNTNNDFGIAANQISDSCSDYFENISANVA